MDLDEAGLEMVLPLASFQPIILTLLNLNSRGLVGVSIFLPPAWYKGGRDDYWDGGIGSTSSF